MTLNEHISKLEPKDYQKLLKTLAKRAEPVSFLKTLLATKPCRSDDRIEIRITDRFYVMWKKKAWFVATKLEIIDLQDFIFCRHRLGDPPSTCELLLYYGKGKPGTWLRLPRAHAYAVFKELSNRAVPMVQLASHPTILAAGKKKSPLGNVYFSGNALMEKNKVLLADIRSVVWLIESWVNGGEDPDDDYVDLILDNGKAVSVKCPTSMGCFCLALELKKRLPYILYGPDNEHSAILKEDPKKLKALLQAGESPSEKQIPKAETPAPGFRRAPMEL